MRLTWYGHSTFKLTFPDASVLIDPFLTGNPMWDGGWEGPAEGTTHVLLTHGHDDHVGDTVAITKATGAQLVGAFEVCQVLNAQGVETINPGNHGGTVDCGPFTVSFVNALHSSAMSTDHGFQYMANPLGLVIRAPGEPTVLAMGDTGIFGDMALINELYAPRVGLVPIGDRFTMGAREAALACRRFFNFETVVPCHYATFGLLDPDASKFVAEMGEAAGIVRVPEVGETIDV